METVNLYAAWIGIFLGFLSGVGLGFFFHKPDWLGGYSSWKRRMLRLGHISFFGLAFINLAYFATLKLMPLEINSSWPSLLLITGAITMPLICFSSAFYKPIRHGFAIPVLSLIFGVLFFVMEGFVL